MSNHTYYLTQRPPSLGCQPMEGLREMKAYSTKTRVTPDIKAWGEVTYNRELTAKEIADYELTPAPTDGAAPHAGERVPQF